MLLAELEQAHWLAVGAADAPVVYMMVDPRCRFCHEFWEMLDQPHIRDGRLQIRLIPVGALGPESERLSARLLEVADPAAVWRDMVAGQTEAVAGTAGEAARAAMRSNTFLFRKWRMDGTPFTVYRGADGAVKVLVGLPGSTADMLNDLPPSNAG